MRERRRMRVDHIPTDRFALDIKRCYLPLVIVSACTGCGDSVSMDLTKINYINNPTLCSDFSTGVSNPVYFYCDKCHEEWLVPIKLKLTARIGE